MYLTSNGVRTNPVVEEIQGDWARLRDWPDVVVYYH